MRHISEEELNSMKQSGKYEWNNKPMTQHHYDSGGAFYLPILRGEPHMFQCLRCRAHTAVDECANCGGNTFEIASPGPGWYCCDCEKGFSTWTCPKCQTQNPAAKTFFLLEKKGCLIATAAYGSDSHHNVAALYDFRDRILLHSRLGSLFVKVYYRIAPLLARMVARSLVLRWTVRTVLIVPVAAFSRAVLENRAAKDDAKKDK